VRDRLGVARVQSYETTSERQRMMRVVGSEGEKGSAARLSFVFIHRHHHIQSIYREYH